MRENIFKGSSIVAIRAPIFRGTKSVTQTARELACTEQELLRAIAYRPSWKSAATKLSAESRRELRAVASALSTSVSIAFEFMLELTAIESVEIALTERKQTRLARRGRRD